MMPATSVARGLWSWARSLALALRRLRSCLSLPSPRVLDQSVVVGKGRRKVLGLETRGGDGCPLVELTARTRDRRSREDEGIGHDVNVRDWTVVFRVFETILPCDVCVTVQHCAVSHNLSGLC
ncbi:uncharacterized protein HD556DRAFT_1393441 [Suillus plorans]|uniref:Secreted protein n=1 Tax=Suillus plorans TaxID=116603 RepID=A0A9P7AIK8_9AGAM|nr:uncharacterized protein HD556DRAFT_1393441 [Suillus plorans]KAG1790217.1 hypothetical protein HD556DRAFT_1393441 [Suillus plorans]